MDHHLPQGRPARTIPDFLLQDHPPHSAIPPMAMGYNNNLALEQALQREIQMRNEQIRQLQMDNMRLQFKLEQAEKDVKAATDMILVACRSGGGAQQSLNPIQRPTAQHIEETNNEAYDIGGHRFDLGDERQGRLQIPVFRRGPARRYGNGFCGAGGDVAGAMQAGADVRHGWSETEENDTSKTASLDEAWTTPKVNKASIKNCEARRTVAATSRKEESSLLDTSSPSQLNDSDEYRMPPPLRPLTPLDRITLSDPFVTVEKVNIRSSRKEKSPTRVQKLPKLPFRHLFTFDKDEETDQAQQDVAQSKHTELDIEGISSRAVCGITSQDSAPQFDARAEGMRKKLEYSQTAEQHRAVSAKTSCPTSSEDRIERTVEPATTAGATVGRQPSSDMEPNTSFESMGDHRGNRHPRRRPDRGFDDYQPHRYNANRAAPWSEEELSYSPVEDAKNYMRTVMIYNLPPQVDIADIVARIADSPILSIKLLPTMGMKIRKTDGSVGTLESMTAIVIFSLDSSAEQFVFDASMEPLVLRGRTATVELLPTPTYPSCLYTGAYTTAPGRILCRRIRFHQPGALPGSFDDILLGRSYGFKQPGWIVDRFMKREAGKNMITLEFNSVETARFAFEQMSTSQILMGCAPRWVYDHETGPSTARTSRLKTRDDDDSSDGEEVTDRAEQIAGETEQPTNDNKQLPEIAQPVATKGLSDSKYARPAIAYEEPEVAPAVPSFSALAQVFVPSKTKESIELDY